MTEKELVAHLSATLDKVRQTSKPIVVTEKAKADLVILDAATYHKQLELLKLNRLLNEGLADILAGRTRATSSIF
jgi:prevent-host-death family protein